MTRDIIDINDFTILVEEASIITDNISVKALPEEAVVVIENKNYVLVSMLNNKSNFKLREVTIGKTYEGIIEILNTEEFDIDAEFLTKRAFNLIAE